MYMTTAPTLPGRRYRKLCVLVGGCYPFFGGPSPSFHENARLHAMSEIEWQAAWFGANAVIGIRTIRSDQSYVLVTGLAVWVYNEGNHEQPKEERRSSWPADMWDFVTEWTQLL